jgi:hypothetical protein
VVIKLDFWLKLKECLATIWDNLAQDIDGLLVQ